MLAVSHVFFEMSAAIRRILSALPALVQPACFTPPPPVVSHSAETVFFSRIAAADPRSRTLKPWTCGRYCHGLELLRQRLVTVIGRRRILFFESVMHVH